jgi:hypothetical protein
MAYFSHAFQKTFVLTDFMLTGDPGAGTFCDAKTFTAVPLGQASVAQHPKVMLVVGGYHGYDTLGSHGGYAESVKSEVIDARHVHRYWRTKGRDVKQHKIRLGWNGTDDDTNPKFYCGLSYHLRIDLKGSPVLRLVDHNFHQIFDVRTGCCAGTTSDPVDPVAVMLQFAKQINEGVISSTFLVAVVLNGDGTVDPDTYVPLTDPYDIEFSFAALQLTVTYFDKQFNYFTMDPRDQYELEPLEITSAQLIDDSGFPCSGFKQLVRTDVVRPRARDGWGHTVLREVILTNEYMQDPFPWDTRKKDIVNFASLAAGTLVPFYFYDSYYILHSTPRKYNPSGVYDNDQYLLRICVMQASEVIPDLEAWLAAYLGSVGVVMEDLSLAP